MEVTIHWEGSVKDKETVDKIISYAKFFADSLGWKTEYVKYPSVTFKEYGFNSANMEKPAYTFIANYDKEAYKKSHSGNYYSNPKYPEEAEQGETEGIIINPAKPFNTESIDLKFYPYKGEYRMNSFCKTQVFSDEELPNLIAHQIIISLLETIKSTWMPNLKIYDEGDFYKSKEDQSKRSLEKNIKDWKENNYSQADIDKWVQEAKEWHPYDYNTLAKAHGANLKLINTFGSLMQKAGYDKKDIVTSAGSSFLEGLEDEKKNNNKKKRLKA